MLLWRITRIVAAIVIPIPFCTAVGEEVSRQAPSIFTEAVLPLLTPVDEVLKSPSQVTVGSASDCIVLLNEEVQFFDAKGNRYTVHHYVSKALTDAGAKAIAEDTWGYRKANQKICLVQAQTILPDGKRLPVAPNASILQSPQRQADNSVYSGSGELRLVFPNVKPGSITESIVVISESEFRIPGEFTAGKWFAWGWPIQTLRYVIEMPAPMADRLKITPVGGNIPEPQKKNLAGDRVRLIWSGKDIPARPNEISSPPTDQVGPVLYLTTLPDWDAFVKWYYPLVEERSMISETLAREVDEWTKDAKNRAEVLDILTTKVAREVRYLSLAFGTADIQPYDCSAVWANQYGDCKDKATLLRAMLRHKGIDASLVLLNTENVGRIERRSPDYRQFDHAILAVYLEPGRPIFCDPTIAYAKAGLISPGDADRDGLLIGSKGAEWVRTPAQSAGEFSYEFDMKLSSSGELSGWMTKNSGGYYGAVNAHVFARLDNDGLRSRANDLIQAFFKGAEIIDVTKSSLENWDGRHQLKTYFIVPSANDHSRREHRVSFPQASLLFNDLGSDKRRQTSFHLWPDTVKVIARISLPEGLQPIELPRLLQIRSEVFDITASWEFLDHQCIARLELRVKESFISPDKFQALFNSHLSLHAWLDRSLGLSAPTGSFV